MHFKIFYFLSNIDLVHRKIKFLYLTNKLALILKCTHGAVMINIKFMSIK